MKRILAFVLLTLSLVSVGLAASARPLPEAPSQQDKNKAVARRVFDEIFNEGKFEVADEIYAKDFANHGLHRDFGLQEDQAAVRWEKMVAPDLKITVDLMMADGDLVTVVWTARGTNTAPIGHLPATGVRIEERGITVWRIVDGKIREEWTSFDLLHILRQVLGQLKWTLMGLLCAALILIWVGARSVRRLRLG
ncbi:MAG: ester cyclase [Candidatus Sulfotelmatobacter sp.]